MLNATTFHTERIPPLDNKLWFCVFNGHWVPAGEYSPEHKRCVNCIGQRQEVIRKVTKAARKTASPRAPRRVIQIPHVCDECKESFIPSRCTQHFCCLKCRRRNWGRAEPVRLVCKCCGKEFVRRHSRQKLCNMECYRVFRNERRRVRPRHQGARPHSQR
jgi:hypothetical protein